MTDRHGLLTAYKSIEQHADDALVLVLRGDLRVARAMLSSHYNRGGGWCYHQGVQRTRYRWPCRLYECARQAIVQDAIPSQRPAAERYTPQKQPQRAS